MPLRPLELCQPELMLLVGSTMLNWFTGDWGPCRLNSALALQVGG